MIGRRRLVIQIVSGKEVVCKQILRGGRIGKNTLFPIGKVRGGWGHSYGCALMVLRWMVA